MPRCFVIGPIGDKFAPLGSPGREKYEQALEVYEKVILTACTQVGLTPVRADHIAIPGEITEQIFRHLYEDEVVIADVSDGNPNVMYELGLRHTRHLLTIQIGEYGQLPFDIQAVRTIEFSRSERGLIDARKRLETALAIGLAEGADPVTATKVWAGAAIAVESRTVDLDPEATGLEIEVDDVNADGYLERIVRVEEAFPRLTTSAERISDCMVEVGVEAETTGREMATLNARNAPTSARLSAMTRFAKGLEKHATEFEDLVESFSAGMEEIDGSVNGILEFLGDHPELRTGDVSSFLEQISALANSGREGMEGVSQFSSSLYEFGEFSKVLRRPARRMSAAMRKMAEKTRLMDEWDAAAIRLREANVVSSETDSSTGNS